jgi:uncharacterized membrane protein
VIGLNEAFTAVAGVAARLIEAAAVLFVAIGAARSAYQALWSLFRGGTLGDRKKVWIRFAMWLQLGLEFELAADIIRSVVAPTWQDIAQLAAIAAIRTLIAYFLARDVDEYLQEAQ